MGPNPILNIKTPILHLQKWIGALAYLGLELSQLMARVHVLKGSWEFETKGMNKVDKVRS